jgi:uncharacterized protein YjbI with pentapeptide repeats
MIRDTTRSRRPRQKEPVAQFPDRRDLLVMSVEEIDDEPTIDSALLSEIAIGDERLTNGHIVNTLFDGVTLLGAIGNALVVRNSGFARSDLSAATLEAATLASCRLEGCKLTGTRLNRAVLKDVTFIECRADIAQFQFARLERVRFERCQMRSAFFNGAKLAKTVFEQCDLSEADFSQSDVTGSDLRRSRIEGIRIAPDQLRDVIVTHDQALYLAGLMGLVIRDE